MDSMLRSDRSVFDLLTADYTFLNERLAMLYGIETVKGGHFRRVHAGRPGAPRPAGQGRRPDADGVSEPHVARCCAARGSWSACSARRRPIRRSNVPSLPENRRGQPAKTAARAARAAPREPDLLRLPRRDGSAGPRAGELRRRGPVPRQRPGHAGPDRHRRSAAGRHAGQGAGRPAPAAGGAARSSVRADDHREPDDLRAGPQPRLPRHAHGAPHRAPGGGPTTTASSRS